MAAHGVSPPLSVTTSSTQVPIVSFVPNDSPVSQSRNSAFFCPPLPVIAISLPSGAHSSSDPSINRQSTTPAGGRPVVLPPLVSKPQSNISPSSIVNTSENPNDTHHDPSSSTGGSGCSNQHPPPSPSHLEASNPSNTPKTTSNDTVAVATMSTTTTSNHETKSTLSSSTSSTSTSSSSSSSSSSLSTPVRSPLPSVRPGSSTARPLSASRPASASKSKPPLPHAFAPHRGGSAGIPQASPTMGNFSQPLVDPGSPTMSHPQGVGIGTVSPIDIPAEVQVVLPPITHFPSITASVAERDDKMKTHSEASYYERLTEERERRMHLQQEVVHLRQLVNTAEVERNNALVKEAVANKKYLDIHANIEAEKKALEEEMARLKQEIMADAVAQACAEDLRRQKIFDGQIQSLRREWEIDFHSKQSGRHKDEIDQLKTAHTSMVEGLKAQIADLKTKLTAQTKRSDQLDIALDAMTASRDRFALAARKYFRSYISMHSWRRLLIAMSAKVFLTRFRYYSQVRGIHRALYSLVLDVSQKTKQAIAHAPRSHWSGQLQSESEEWLGVARQYIRLYDSYTQSATSVKKQKAELHTQLRTDIDYLQSTSRSSLSVGNNNSGHGLPTTSGLGSPGLHPSGMPGLPQAMTHRRASLVQEEEALKRTLAKIQDPALWNHIADVMPILTADLTSALAREKSWKDLCGKELDAALTLKRREEEIGLLKKQLEAANALLSRGNGDPNLTSPTSSTSSSSSLANSASSSTKMSPLTSPIAGKGIDPDTTDGTMRRVGTSSGVEGKGGGSTGDAVKYRALLHESRQQNLKLHVLVKQLQTALDHASKNKGPRAVYVTEQLKTPLDPTCSTPQNCNVCSTPPGLSGHSRSPSRTGTENELGAGMGRSDGNSGVSMGDNPALVSTNVGQSNDAIHTHHSANDSSVRQTSNLPSSSTPFPASSSPLSSSSPTSPSNNGQTRTTTPGHPPLRVHVADRGYGLDCLPVPDSPPSSPKSGLTRRLRSADGQSRQDFRLHHRVDSRDVHKDKAGSKVGGDSGKGGGYGNKILPSPYRGKGKHQAIANAYGQTLATSTKTLKPTQK